METKTSLSNIVGGLVVFGIPAGILLMGLLIPIGSGIVSWLLILGLLTVFIFVAGYLLNGRVLGCLIDGRNQMSLSRFQTIVWTILILSAFLAELLIRTRAGEQPALAISVREQIWLLLGISATSLVGSPLIRNSKKDQDPRPDEKKPEGPMEESPMERNVQRLAAQDNVPREDITNVGRIIVKGDPSEASLSDMFKGDEISDCSQLDLGKIQMFYFTLVLVLAYGVQLGSLFPNRNRFQLYA